MRLILIFFTALAFSSMASAAPKTLPYTTSYENCDDGGNGLAANGQNNNPNAPGQNGRTRRGNNGHGNGGEAIDVYISAEFGEVVHIHYVCYSTESESSEGGSRYINGNYIGPSFGSEFELDPGKI
ncbi:MAG: hypothetical protein CMP91_04575 [Gammaproteobacteria bacterium]|nr:hypothetical protein [Gammaproteobacteria bacterium]MAY03301.1 hypothetical protein [Gammaproteobacteria bacterium]|tara:strand:+ start:1273 stop:1650 length:378 start_codon:yes stop_codon:yes gene_type:complete